MFGLFGMDGDRDSSDYEDDELFFRQLSRRRGRRRRNNFAEMIMDLTAFLGEQDPDYMDRFYEDDMEEDIYQATGDLEARKPQKVTSLLEMSSVAVAKYCSCEVLESAQPPLDEGLLKKVAFWAFPQDPLQVQVFADMTNGHWDTGESLVNQNKIREMWQVGFMATAYITKFTSTATAPDEVQGTDIRVSLTFERQRIVSSSCSECRAQVWCQHIIAAIIYRIKFPEKVIVHAPMTETLSTLDRVQLQKLLQYAVQEDPAGILGKVFKHLDEVRDTNSDMNREQGAPDPTFGYQEGKTQWELSLDNFLDSFQRQLDTLCNRRYYYDAGSTYPATYDLSRKIKSPMYRYLKKVLELSRRGEGMLAVEALAAITKAVMPKLKSLRGLENPSLKTFTQDLIGTYTKLALSPHQDKEARTHLLNTILGFSITPTDYDLEMAPSGWADLPILRKLKPLGDRAFELLGEQANRTKHTKCWLFREPLAGLSLDQDRQGQWPGDLIDLMEGRVSAEDSPYNEDICVMLARLETLLNVEPQFSAKMGILAKKILHTLQEMALKDSVLGHCYGSQTLSQIIQTGKGNPATPKKKKVPTATLR